MYVIDCISLNKVLWILESIVNAKIADHQEKADAQIREVSFAHNLFCSSPIDLDFLQSTAVILSCSVQNVKTTGQLKLL